MYTCPPGWGCELATGAVFETYDTTDRVRFAIILLRECVALVKRLLSEPR